MSALGNVLTHTQASRNVFSKRAYQYDPKVCFEVFQVQAYPYLRNSWFHEEPVQAEFCGRRN
jgi:hypothetical protein